jgi:hypothetical protein
MRRAASLESSIGLPGILPPAPARRSRALDEKEASVLDRIRKVLEKCGVLVWRNHVGLSRQGSGRFARSGLAKGASDLVGLVSPSGRFIAIEVKRPRGGRVSEDQERWLALVRACGGVAGVVRSVEEALELVAAARRRP